MIEQNGAGSAFGFGVVFSQGALSFLERDALDLYARLLPRMESWALQRVVHRDAQVDIDGNGFSVIGSVQLNQFLQEPCRDAGVYLHFGKCIARLADWGDAGLAVGGYGVNSIVRQFCEPDFAPRMEWLTNKFVWYGTRNAFDCLTLLFRANEHGAWVAHHYRFAPDRSTFLVECDAATWQRAGLATMSDEASRAYCEKIFAADLDGEPLLSNNSIWRNFPLLRNGHWRADNVTLIGDALHTAHFSTGSGTRLAFKDAIALDRAFAEAGVDVPAALAAYERAHRPIVKKIIAAANSSSFWYEHMADKMQLEPWQLAYDYMAPSGRISEGRLAQMAPRFMAHVVDKRRGISFAGDPYRIRNPFERARGHANEIGFSMTARYNCSRILYDNIAAGRAIKSRLSGVNAELLTANCAHSPSESATAWPPWAWRAVAACCCYCTTPLSMSPQSLARCALGSCRC